MANIEHQLFMAQCEVARLQRLVVALEKQNVRLAEKVQVAHNLAKRLFKPSLQHAVALAKQRKAGE